MSALQTIPLSKLKPSKLNVRKTGGKSVDDLAASIRAIGLQQNLGVLETAKGFEVVYGNRRLRALQALAKAGELPAALSDGVPCNVLDDSAAHEASLAENTVREAMHPLDQFAAFAKMVDEGRPVADVAAAFGVSELVVKQRMRLSSVSPKLQKIYGAGGMTLEQLQAFAVSDDHAAQERVWKACRDDYDKKPNALRQSLLRTGIQSDSGIVTLVGLENYIAAGGAIHEDLFSDTKVLLDELLLQRLIDTAIEQWVDQVKDEGWSWVEVGDSPNYNAPKIVPEIHFEDGMSDEQQADYDLAYESGDDATVDAIEAAATTWPEGTHAKAGAIVVVNRRTGSVVVYRGMLRDGETHVASSVEVDGDDDNCDDQLQGKAEPSPPAAESQQRIPASLVADLTAERTRVLREAMNAQPEKAFNLMLADLAGVWLEGHSWNGIVGLHLHSRFQPRDGDLEAERTKYWQKILAPLPDRLSWITLQPMDRRLELLAFLTSLQLDTTVYGGTSGCAELVDHLGVDMADRWRPDAEFFSRIPADLTYQILADIGESAETIAGFRKLKKKELAGRAAALVAPTRWLPACLNLEQQA